MLENIRLSLQGVWSHKMRSFLTMLGIIIGIASIISIVSTIQGTNEQIKENLLGAGNNTVNVRIYQGDWPYEFYDYSPAPQGIPVISEEVRQQIEDLDEVESVTLYNSRAYAEGVFYRDKGLQGANVLGVTENYFSTCGYMVRTGRQFLEEDFTNFHKVAILDQTAASSLFQEESALGKTIEIKGEPFTVVGVAQKKDEFEPVINSMEDYETYMGEQASGIVYLPASAWGIVYQYDEPQNVVVRVDSTDNMTAVGKSCADILNSYLSPKDDTIKYKAKDLLEQAQQIQELSSSTNTMLIWIAGISLIVGGIGVMNIMLVSVTERTQEIGLKKAIGARKGKILGQFLTEAAVLTSLGGILGVLAGTVLAQVISYITTTPVAISIPAAIISVLFSMAIGIVFGVFPSYKAANLNPIDALRHE